MDQIPGFTIEECFNFTGSLIFQARNYLVTSVGFGELAREELDASHPAFAHFAESPQAAERAYAPVKQFDDEFYRRRQKAETQNP